MQHGKIVGLTKKGEFTRNMMIYTSNLLKLKGASITVGLVFVNMEKDAVSNDDLKKLFECEVGIITQDELMKAAELQSKESKGVEAIDLTSVISWLAAERVGIPSPQIVFVDSVEGWRRQLLEIIKGVTENVVVKNAVIGLLDPQNIRFAFAESLALASVLGTDAKDDMLEFIKGKAKQTAEKLGIPSEQLMPDVDVNNNLFTVKPTEIDEMKLKQETANSSA